MQASNNLAAQDTAQLAQCTHAVFFPIRVQIGKISFEFLSSMHLCDANTITHLSCHLNRQAGITAVRLTFNKSVIDGWNNFSISV